MNKKLLYGTIAIVIAVILIISALMFIPRSTPQTTTALSIMIAASGIGIHVDQSVTYYAFINVESSNAPSSVLFNFGDGTTGIAPFQSYSNQSGAEYTIPHVYTSAGSYMITASATVNGQHLNYVNNNGFIPFCEQFVYYTGFTAPSINITSPSPYHAQIYNQSSTIFCDGHLPQSPNATNWTEGYYIWNFGEGLNHTYDVLKNTSSGNFMPDNVSVIYNTSGIYVVTLDIITFNATNYVPSSYTINGNVYTYYPLSDLSSILSSGQYHDNTYKITVIILAPSQKIIYTVFD